jgi:hypothetical protein
MTTTRADVATATLRVAALPADRLRAVRERGVDDFGNAFAVRTDAEGGSPLRCCLRESTPGERIALVAWSPFAASGPYAEVGPVFVHADECAGYDRPGSWPAGFRGRRQILRAYAVDGSIRGARLVEPDEAPEAAALDLLADPGVAFLHSRNVLFGCYMFEIRRPG